MAASDDIDLAPIVVAAAGAFILYQFWRYSTASYGFSFGTSAPAGTGLQSLLNDLPMTVSPQGRAFIQSWETLSLTPYADAGGRAVGWGHRITPQDNITGPITYARAVELFNSDIAAVQDAINSSVTVALTQNQFDALADFAYNVGVSGFANSTLVKLLNQGNYASVAQQLARWNKAQGQVNSDLTKRRSAEAQNFASG